MTHEEKILYYRVHPLNLLTDWTVGFTARPLLWHHLGALTCYWSLRISGAESLVSENAPSRSSRVVM
jgi:hypothetical protein